MRDVACTKPFKNQGNCSCPMPAGPSGGIFMPDPLGLELCLIVARRLSTSVSLPCSVAAAVLNTALPTPVQAAPPVQASSPAQPRPPAQPQTLFQTQPLLQTTPAILPQPTAATVAAPTPKPVDAAPQITVQPAGFAFSPGIVSCCPHPGLTRDGPKLGPRVERPPQWRISSLNTALPDTSAKMGSH